MSHWVNCDVSGCRNGYVGHRMCSKCFGLGRIEVYDNYQRRSLLKTSILFLLIAAGVFVAAFYLFGYMGSK